jgi:hypothetical protein
MKQPEPFARRTEPMRTKQELIAEQEVILTKAEADKQKAYEDENKAYERWHKANAKRQKAVAERERLKQLPDDIVISEKPKLVWEVVSDCFYVILLDNRAVCYICKEEDIFYGYSIDKYINKQHIITQFTLELAQQACEQFLTELLTPKTDASLS